ncbi:MAG TPA: response regulator [Spirochaetota bacterium]|nr:response regulator [Spirochaetota bacterium]HRZ28877.1 response regulator [Spirochaetota bacterium]HSA14526.1 response regulator [Spirochaetota bacterium]
METMKKKIMLVEDEAITALDMANMLKNIGYDVAATIASGEEAVQKAPEIKPDLILMDIMLSDELDGIDATRQIKEKMNVPVVYLTGNADSRTFKRAGETNHLGYLIKPVSRDNLKSVLSTALQRHILQQEQAHV